MDHGSKSTDMVNTSRGVAFFDPQVNPTGDAFTRGALIIIVQPTRGFGPHYSIIIIGNPQIVSVIM